MDDPQLQRAIYASIQTARSQGYNLVSSKTFQPSRGISHGGAGAHRSTVASITHDGKCHRNQAYRLQPQQPARSNVDISLPGMSAAAAASTTAGSSTHVLRTSFGRIEALRRDGIVPASAGPIYPHPLSLSRSLSQSHARNQPLRGLSSGDPGPRALPTAVSPRMPPSPQRLHRNRTQQLPAHQRPAMQAHVIGPQRAVNPVLEAIAAVTVEAHAAFDGGSATTTTSPITFMPPSRTATAPTSIGSRGGGGGVIISGPVTVGGNGPPPRSLVPVAMSSGPVVMVPEGMDPVLAQAVLRDVVTWDTGVTFDDIAGCDRAKQLLHEAVALPLIIPEFFTGIREPWRGVLLHGPPGNGKTMLAKAVVGMVGGAFFAVSPASLTSKWRGESEKLLATLFAAAQAHAPAIIFIDEVDALGGARGGDGEHEASRRFKAELLQQMDGLASGRGVIVLAATNCPWDLDPALRRRFEKRIHIGLPDVAQRLALLQLHLRGVELAADVDLPGLAVACEGFSGADLRLLCRDAAMAPLRRQIGGLAVSKPGGQEQQQSSPSSLPQSTTSEPQTHPAPHLLMLRSAADIRRLADSGELARGAVVSAADLEAARGSVRPSVASEQAARYVQWDQEFAST